tara:strand:+ start:1945 stop:2271 length:327 start_codon:yes stop_codon:yes gene_type:complete
MDFGAGIALSLHLFLEGDYNAIHPYVEIDQNRWAAGIYYNSERNISAYALKSLSLGRGYDLEIGAVTGYSQADILPMVRIRKDRFFVAPVQETSNGKKKYGIIFGIQF